MDLKRLYSPGKLGRMDLKNRWIMLAMHTGYANEDGTFSQRDMAFYKRRAQGGMAAITIVGGVNEIGCQANMHRLDSIKYESGIRDACNLIHKQDCKVIMQLFHAGRNNTIEIHDGKPPLCPSSVASPIYRTPPKEMSQEEIYDTIEAFAEAAKRCKNCGVDGIEVSVSAGYLLSQFLSPLVNCRNDQWGGSAKKRMKFPSEVLKAVRKAVGTDYTVIIKISSGDMLGGYELSDMINFINQLPKGTIDGVTVTGGWHEAPVPQISYHVQPGYFAHFAEEVRNKTRLPVIACNRINDGKVAEGILAGGIVDFVGAARPFLTDPDFANKIKNKMVYNKCQGCNRGCIERVLKYHDVCCAFNPEAGREYLGKPKKKYISVLVVGAGPVGLQTAKYLLESGTKVTVITKEHNPGGKLEVASAPPFKHDIRKFGDYLVEEVIKLGGRILTDTIANEEIINQLSPDFVIFATGADPVNISVEGLAQSNIEVYEAEKILRGNHPKEKCRIVVIGGGIVGLETAEYLSTLGNDYKITVVEMQPKAGKDFGGLKWIMLKSLSDKGVTLKTSSRVCAAFPNGLLVEERRIEENGEMSITETILPCDTVIFAIGYKSRKALELGDYLDLKGIEYVTVGDALKPGNMMKGLMEAWDAVR